MKQTRECEVQTNEKVRVIPLEDIPLELRLFDPTAKKKCFIVRDQGPPPVLEEIDCADLVIVIEKDDKD